MQGNNEYVPASAQYSGEMSLERSANQNTPSESTFPNNDCSCLSCRQIGTMHRGVTAAECSCRVKGCDQTFPGKLEHTKHERQHYVIDKDPYTAHCPELECVFTVSCCYWDDLIRHTRSKHCKKDPKFPCPLAWCNRSGDRGFTRKDKLTNHLRSVHKRDIPKKPRRVRGIKFGNVDEHLPAY